MTGDGGGCAQGAGYEAWAGAVGAGQVAGASAVGQGIGNDARLGEWPGGYSGGGGVVGRGAAGINTAPGIRAEACSSQAAWARGRRRGRPACAGWPP